jgi:hypothetical protein
MLSYPTSAMFVLVFTAALGAATLGVLFFFWGRLMGRAGLRSNATKWKTYAFTLVPAAVLALSCLHSAMLTPVAWKTFFVVSCPAMLGVFHRWHWGSREYY